MTLKNLAQREQKEGEMLVIVDLRDHAISHRVCKIYLDEEADIVELQRQICLYLPIEAAYQEVSDSKGKRVDLLPGTLRENGVSDGETLYVKHSHLNQWIAYQKSVDDFKVAKERAEKKSHAENAKMLCDKLCDVRFGFTYFSLCKELYDQVRQISECLDERHYSVSLFFKMGKYHGPNAHIGYAKIMDEEGREGDMCIATVGYVAHKYRLKTRRNASVHQDKGHNIMELYCYKLLEAIGVGANIYLIPSCDSSEPEVYIASELVRGFRTFHSLRFNEADSDKTLHALVQIHFLSSILGLDGMYDYDFGLSDGFRPKIVSFKGRPLGRLSDNTFLYMESLWHLGESFAELLHDCSSAQRLLIAKQSLKSWDFETKLEDVLKQMREDVKNFGPAYQKQEKDLERYVAEVKTFVRNLNVLETDYLDW